MGDVGDDAHAKTGHGIAYWRPQLCAGQLRLPGCAVDLGLPEMSVDDAVSSGVRTAIIGVASTGGVLRDTWLPTLEALANRGIDIVAGTHAKIKDADGLRRAALNGNARLIDVRIPPQGIPVGRGRRRSGKRVLTVGTDCCVGKKYSALALHREFEQRGIDADFCATGQTGIMIAGKGIPIDAVVADFISGAAEMLSPDNDADHWDFIEGQGSLTHPSYAGVSLGLLHGSQADALILCHDAARRDLSGMQDQFAMPPLKQSIGLALECARVTNPDCIWGGISVNTSMLGDHERDACLAALEAEFKLPCADPLITGVARIADYLLETVR